MSKDKQYKYDELPKSVETSLNTYYCYHSEYSWMTGKVVHAIGELPGDSYLLLAKTNVKVKLAEKKEDIKKLAVEALKKEKEKQQAEHFKKMFELQEKIDSLLCLEYTPAPKDMADDSFNDIPF